MEALLQTCQRLILVDNEYAKNAEEFLEDAESGPDDLEDMIQKNREHRKEELPSGMS